MGAANLLTHYLRPIYGRRRKVQADYKVEEGTINLPLYLASIPALDSFLQNTISYCSTVNTLFLRPDILKTQRHRSIYTYVCDIYAWYSLSLYLGCIFMSCVYLLICSTRRITFIHRSQLQKKSPPQYSNIKSLNNKGQG